MRLPVVVALVTSCLSPARAASPLGSCDEILNPYGFVYIARLEPGQPLRLIKDKVMGAPRGIDVVLEARNDVMTKALTSLLDPGHLWSLPRDLGVFSISPREDSRYFLWKHSDGKDKPARVLDMIHWEESHEKVDLVQVTVEVLDPESKVAQILIMGNADLGRIRQDESASEIARKAFVGRLTKSQKFVLDLLEGLRPQPLSDEIPLSRHDERVMLALGYQIGPDGKIEVPALNMNLGEAFESWQSDRILNWVIDIDGELRMGLGKARDDRVSDSYLHLLNRQRPAILGGYAVLQRKDGPKSSSQRGIEIVIDYDHFIEAVNKDAGNINYNLSGRITQIFKKFLGERVHVALVSYGRMRRF